MNWHNVDWSAVVAALVALWNAFQHHNLKQEVRLNHEETLAAVKGPIT